MRQIKSLGHILTYEQTTQLTEFMNGGGILTPGTVQLLLTTDILLAKQHTRSGAVANRSTNPNANSHSQSHPTSAPTPTPTPTEIVSVPPSSKLDRLPKISIVPINGSLLI